MHVYSYALWTSVNLEIIYVNICKRLTNCPLIEQIIGRQYLYNYNSAANVYFDVSYQMHHFISVKCMSRIYLHTPNILTWSATTMFYGNLFTVCSCVLFRFIIRTYWFLNRVLDISDCFELFLTSYGSAKPRWNNLAGCEALALE